MRKFFAVAALSVLLSGCTTTEKVIVSTKELEPELPKAPSITNSAKELTRICDAPVAEFFPRLSPDGKKILYFVKKHVDCENEQKPVNNGQKAKKEVRSIEVKSIGEPGRTALTQEFTDNASWYPDGQNYLFRYSRPDKTLIARGKIGTMAITYVTPNAMGNSDDYASINPKADKIVFSTSLRSKDTEGAAKENICLVDPDGMNFTILVEGCQPCWHPRENVILYVNSVGTNWHIFLYNIDRGEITQLTSGESNNIQPFFSPDGNSIVFISDRARDGFHIYVMKADGIGITQLTSGKTIENDPCWGADGYIYFVSNAGLLPGSKTPWDYSDIWRLRPVLPDTSPATSKK